MEKYLKALNSVNRDKFNTRAEWCQEANSYLDSPMSPATWRSVFSRNPVLKEHVEEVLKSPQVDGVTAADQWPSIDETLHKLHTIQRRTKELDKQKKSQTVKASGPACLVFMADTHLENSGTDLDRLFREIEIIKSIPQVQLYFLGDTTDNFIATWCRSIRYKTEITTEEALVLMKHFFDLISEELVGVVGGNHDSWLTKAVGVDLLKWVLSDIDKPILYDPDELYVRVDTPAYSTQLLMRHHFKAFGSSQYSDTHAIEKAAKFSQGKPFNIGVHGHTHRNGLIRPFSVVDGKTKLAVLCGAYKRYDRYAREIGFPEQNEFCAVSVVLHPEYGLIPCMSLEMARDIMQTLI